MGKPFHFVIAVPFGLRDPAAALSVALALLWGEARETNMSALGFSARAARLLHLGHRSRHTPSEAATQARTEALNSRGFRVRSVSGSVDDGDVLHTHTRDELPRDALFEVSSP